MSLADCMSCATLAGTPLPPGGIVDEDACWAFFLRPRPLLIPGQGFIVLKRHCERLNDLLPDEAQALGPMMQRVEQALTHVLKPVRVHFGLYGEGVHHLHRCLPLGACSH
jgi:diadenosine tetraphosphate (Ap4A) HIT family hydrolase